MNPESTSPTETARFRDIDHRDTSRSSQALWFESIIQVEKGWLNAPLLLGGDGNWRDKPDEQINIAFRIGVSRADKLRGRGDLEDSLTKHNCHAGTSIQPPGRGHITAASEILSGAKAAWPLGEIGREAAHKALPLREGDSV